MCTDPEPGNRLPSPHGSESAHEAIFDRMLEAFAASGGLARDDRARRQQPPCADGDGREDGTALVVEWRGTWWTPRFQFDRPSGSLRTAVRHVLAELSAFLDGWEAAAWFCEPNLWLGDRRPVDWIDEHPDCVLGAARADRFIALG